MTPKPNKLNWKLATTVGAITGVAIGGFVMAGPSTSSPTPDQVILDEVTNSVPRLSAPVVVPTTAAQLASAASVRSPMSPIDRQVSVPAPVTTADVAAAVVEVDSTPSPVSPMSAESPVSPMSAESPVSPMSAESPDSGASS